MVSPRWRIGEATRSSAYLRTLRNASCLGGGELRHEALWEDSKIVQNFIRNTVVNFKSKKALIFLTRF